MVRKRKRVEGWGVRETKRESVQVLAQFGVETRNQGRTFQLGLVTVIVAVGKRIFLTLIFIKNFFIQSETHPEQVSKCPKFPSV